MTTEDIDLIIEFRKSPLFFIQKMWGLVPQPILSEHKEQVFTLLVNQQYDDIKVEFFDKFVIGKHITWQQFMLCHAVEMAITGKGKSRISVKSGHGTGKDTGLSWLILWFEFCFENAQIPCTAPTSEQIHDILWKEIAIWLYKMPEKIQAKYEYQSNYIRIVDSPNTWFARARTARKEKPEALAGVHGKHVMFVADESSGVADEIYNTAEGSLTGEKILFIMISNPTRLTGYFYDSHHTDAPAWQLLHFNSEDSPIVEEGFIQRIITKHGKDSDEYKIRVLGEFPKAEIIDAKGYVPLLIAPDLRFTTRQGFVGNRVLGIDVAGEGSNKTSWVIRDDFIAMCVARESVSNPKGIAQKTLTLMTYYKIDAQFVFIDIFGEGAKVLLYMPDSALINGILPQDKPDNEDDAIRFLNLRALGYWGIKEWIRSGGELFQQKSWKPQLLAQRYRRNLSGKIQLMPKKDLGIESPDDTDALSLTFMSTTEMNDPNEIERKYKESIRMMKRGKTGQ